MAEKNQTKWCHSSIIPINSVCFIVKFFETKFLHKLLSAGEINPANSTIHFEKMFQSHILWRYRDIAKVDLEHIKKFYEHGNALFYSRRLSSGQIHIRNVRGRRLHAPKLKKGWNYVNAVNFIFTYNLYFILMIHGSNCFAYLNKCM